jgi:hypothetical protein
MLKTDANPGGLPKEVFGHGSSQPFRDEYLRGDLATLSAESFADRVEAKSHRPLAPNALPK